MLSSFLVPVALLLGCSGGRLGPVSKSIEVSPDLDLREEVEVGDHVELELVESTIVGRVDEINADALRVNGRWYTSSDVLRMVARDIGREGPGAEFFFVLFLWTAIITGLVLNSDPVY